MATFLHLVENFSAPFVVKRISSFYCLLQGKHKVVSYENKWGGKYKFKFTSVSLNGLQDVTTEEEKKNIINIIINNQKTNIVLIYDTRFIELLEMTGENAVLIIKNAKDINDILQSRNIYVLKKLRIVTFNPYYYFKLLAKIKNRVKSIAFCYCSIHAAFKLKNLIKTDHFISFKKYCKRRWHLFRRKLIEKKSVLSFVWQIKSSKKLEI